MAGLAKPLMAQLRHGRRAKFRKAGIGIREMTATTVHASSNAATLRRRLGRSLAIALAAAGVLTFVGAMGTSQAPLTYRMGYWAAVILPGSVLGFAMQTLVDAWGGFAGRRWTEIAVVALLVSLPHSFVVIVATALFFGIGVITPIVVLNFWLAVFVVALVLTAINHLAAVDEREAASAPPKHPQPPLAEPAPTLAPDPDPSPLPAMPLPLAERMPPALRGARLIALEAEDHYLRFHTDRGSDLVLMRMGDACALLPDTIGARVHRSWWVARTAVTGRAMQGGKMELALLSGLVAPVSRAMQPVIREAGWGTAAD